MAITRVALLTAGGYAPCLSSAVGGLIERYTELMPEVEIIGYRHGYHGVLSNTKVVIDDEARRSAHLLHAYGGSPLGNSRVKLTNAKDLEKRGLVKAGQDPLEAAAQRLADDGVDVLHTIGGDDTNTTAADLAAFLRSEGTRSPSSGCPRRSTTTSCRSASRWGGDRGRAGLALRTERPRRARRQPADAHRPRGHGARLRWLTGATAREYLRWRDAQQWVPSIGLTPERWGVHAVYVPEAPIDLDAEADRLRGVMDEIGCVNLFVSEGAGVEEIVARWRLPGRRSPATRSATSSSTRSTRAHGSPSSSPSGSAPRRRWCRRAGTSPAPPRPTPRTWPSSARWCTSLSTRRSPAPPGSSATTRSAATSCGPSSSTGSRAARPSTRRSTGSRTSCGHRPGVAPEGARGAVRA